MKTICLQCGHEFKRSYSYDDLGWHTSCPNCCGSFDVDGAIRLDELETWEDIIDAFNTLKIQATRIGMPICLNTTASNDLELYFHDDYPDRILVDKLISKVKKICKRCGAIVNPSDVVGYPYVCPRCDENMYDFEVEDCLP